VSGGWDIANGVQGRLLRRIVLAAWIMAASGLVCFGQTNSPGPAARANASTQTQLAPPRARLFPPPELMLHDLPFKSAPAGARLPPQTGAMSSHMSSELTPAQVAAFERIEREGQLKPHEPAYNSDVERKLAAAFKPKIIRVGHVQIYSPIVTAIARKNPLCLLDPMVLGISF
jgi:hypothetical protein